MEETKLKFKLRKGKGSVSEFVDSSGNRFKPGEVLELPISYSREKWLEPVKSEKPEFKQDLDDSPKKKQKSRKPKTAP